MPYYGGDPQQADPKFLMDRLMKNGYSRAQAAAIVGNLQRESGLASNNMNKDEGAYGLMQWRGPRFEALQNFAAQKGTLWTDPGTQADFIAHEMKTTEAKNAAPFLAATTVDEASAALKPVIRYGDQSLPQRTMFARNAFGAADAAPEAAAPPVQTPQPAPAARYAVSRETSPYDMSAQEYARYQRDSRGMRGGLSALGDLGAAAIYRNRRDEAAGQPGIFQRMGNAISGAAQSMGAQPVPAQAPPGAAMPVQAPPGAPEPPRFPGGIPQPRPRPVLNPDLMRNDPALPGQLIPTDTVAGLDSDRMGALVDPTTGYDYG
jgi:hypothetical protein